VLTTGLLSILKPTSYRNEVPAIIRDVSLKKDLLSNVVPQLVKQVTGVLRLYIGIVELAL
jgi:hypothetical protein